jgi:hypothetical protein
MIRVLFLFMIGLSTVSPKAFGFGDQAKVAIAQLVLDNGGPQRVNAIAHLTYELSQTTSVEVSDEVVHLSLRNDELFSYPFLLLMGEEAFGLPDEQGVQRLSRYLANGGFLLIDDSSEASSSGFDASVRALMRAVYPTKSFTPFPADHSLYRSFFMIDRPMGRTDRFGVVWGINEGNVSPVLYFRDDLMGALDRDDAGRDRYPCVPDGRRQRREAVKLAVNVVMYALTANYKRDQAHVKQLILEGRLE